MNWKHSQWKNIYCVGHKGKVHVYICTFTCNVHSLGSCISRFNIIIITDSDVPHIYMCFAMYMCIYIIMYMYLQVDLQCVSATSGGYYYPDHLPILGNPMPHPRSLMSLTKRFLFLRSCVCPSTNTCTVCWRRGQSGTGSRALQSGSGRPWRVEWPDGRGTCTYMYIHMNVYITFYPGSILCIY